MLPTGTNVVRKIVRSTYHNGRGGETVAARCNALQSFVDVKHGRYGFRSVGIQRIRKTRLHLWEGTNFAKIILELVPPESPNHARLKPTANRGPRLSSLPVSNPPEPTPQWKQS